MKPITAYIENPLTQALAAQHGAYLQNASNHQLLMLVNSHVVAMASANCLDPEALALSQGVIEILQSRLTPPTVRRFPLKPDRAWMQAWNA